MTVDMSISLGHILTIVGMLITLVTWGNNLRWHVGSVERRLETVEESIKEISKMIVQANLLAQRLEHLEKHIDRLESRTTRDSRKLSHDHD